MKEIIATTGAPGAIGPYSQATKAGSLVFVSGQLPIDPATGVMPEDVAAQTKQSLTNGKAIVEAAGGSMADVVKTTVFLADMNDFAAMNAVYAEFLKVTCKGKKRVAALFCGVFGILIIRRRFKLGKLFVDFIERAT